MGNSTCVDAQYLAVGHSLVWPPWRQGQRYGEQVGSSSSSSRSGSGSGGSSSRRSSSSDNGNNNKSSSE